MCANEVLLTATSQNSERLAKLLCRAPPPFSATWLYAPRIYKNAMSADARFSADCEQGSGLKGGFHHALRLYWMCTLHLIGGIRRGGRRRLG
jgi:hypothetical protein